MSTPTVGDTLYIRVDTVEALRAELAQVKGENERLRNEWAEYVCGHRAEVWVLRENCPVCDAILADTLMSRIGELEAAILNEPELPGEMPDEMWAAIQETDKDGVTALLRMTVRQTKEGIIKRAALGSEKDT